MGVRNGTGGAALPSARGWPDPEGPGYPENPGKDGPHLLRKNRRRTWAWWHYRGRSWLLPDARNPTDRAGTLNPGEVGKDWTYIGPAVVPDGKPVP
jgi:hypothetical protein